MAEAALASEVHVVVSGAVEPGSEVACRLYSVASGFPEGDPVVAKQRVSASGACHFTNVAPGNYAVSVAILHKGENSMPHDFLGRPKRPWGVSNNVRPSLRAPRFGEAAFRVGTQGTTTISITVKR